MTAAERMLTRCHTALARNEHISTLAEAVAVTGYRVEVRHDLAAVPCEGEYQIGAGAVMGRDGTVYLQSNDWQHAYSAAHEIAESLHAYNHTPQMFACQAELLSLWLRLLARSTP